MEFRKKLAKRLISLVINSLSIFSKKAYHWTNQFGRRSRAITSEAPYTGYNLFGVRDHYRRIPDIPTIRQDKQTIESYPMTTKRVLLVEDYPANVLVATTLLEDFGYAYEVATTGDEAIKKIKQGEFDIALMDVQLGDAMCGFEATRHVRDWEQANQKTRRLPIIAMTAHALTGDREKCLDAGMDDYISKPFDADELKEKLQQHSQQAA